MARDEEAKKKTVHATAIKCTACGGDLVKAHRTEGTGEDQDEVPVARCLSCSKEYDRHSEEYYQFFADTFIQDLDTGIFKLGLKGTLKGVEYEIIGHVRYQDEDEYEVDTWDEWLGISADGVYTWFVDEEGDIYSYVEYVPESIDLESDKQFIIFEGRKINRTRSGFTSRIVYAQGELPWKPEIGEAITQYDFKKDGIHFTIEQSEDEVSITKAEKIPRKDVILAFRKDDYQELNKDATRIAKNYLQRSRVYLAALGICLVYLFWSCTAGDPVTDIMKHKINITSNELKKEQSGWSYHNQALYGPVNLDKSETLYELTISINESVQKLSLEWESYIVLLIREDKLAGIIRDGDMAKLKSMLSEVDSFIDPIESFVVAGDCWDEQGYDSEGYWHESDTKTSHDFVLTDAGKYYLFLETYSQKARNIDATVITITKGVMSSRYFIIIAVLFAGLFAYNRSKYKSQTQQFVSP